MGNPPKRFHPLVRLVLCAGGIALATGIMSAALFAGSIVASQWTRRDPASQLAAVLQANPLLLNLLLYPSVVAWVAFCRTALDKRPFLSLGLEKLRAGGNLWAGMVAGFLSITLLWLVLWICGGLRVSFPSPEWTSTGPAMGLLTLAGLFLFFATVAFVEELVFRGYIFHNLAVLTGVRAAVVLQAFLFALIHLPNADPQVPGSMAAAWMAMPSIVLVGILFAYAYSKTGSLWFPIGFHWTWNFFLGSIYSLPVSGISMFRLLDVQSAGNSWLSGGSFGAEASPLLLPILGASILVLSRLPDHPTFAASLAADEAPVAPTTKPRSVFLRGTRAEPAGVVNAVDAAEEEGQRTNRYSSRFGKTDRFDSQLLRELKAMEAAREAAAKAEARVQGQGPVVSGQVSAQQGDPTATLSGAAQGAAAPTAVTVAQTNRESEGESAAPARAPIRAALEGQSAQAAGQVQLPAQPAPAADGPPPTPAPAPTRKPNPWGPPVSPARAATPAKPPLPQEIGAEIETEEVGDGEADGAMRQAPPVSRPVQPGPSPGAPVAPVAPPAPGAAPAKPEAPPASPPPAPSSPRPAQKPRW